MSTFDPSVLRRRAVRRLGVIGVIGAASLASGLAVVTATSASATTEPPSTEPAATGPATPPIAAEEFTRLDPETAVRGRLTDEVTASISITRHGMEPVMIDIADLSNIAVARFTVQPGAQFPWHTHAGSVIVSVVEGELVYVMKTDCSEHSYAAGTAFLDPGHGEVHSAYNPTDAPTVIVATFLEAPADGPLVITEGVTASPDNCGMPTS